MQASWWTKYKGWIIGLIALILLVCFCCPTIFGLTAFVATRNGPPVIVVPYTPPSAPPVVVQPPAVQPPVVQPPAVQPPVVQPPAVQPPVVQPPAVQPPAAVPPANSYPLTGQRYESPQGDSYSAVWTNDGRLWQPQLPPGAKRIAHTVAFTIEEGNYAFDGVECRLFVDAARNGNGASNPVTAEYGNDLRFSVSTADHGQAWALVQCRGNASSGFQIRWLGK